MTGSTKSMDFLFFDHGLKVTSLDFIVSRNLSYLLPREAYMLIGGSSKVTVVGPIQNKIIFIDISVTYELISFDLSFLHHYRFLHH